MSLILRIYNKRFQKKINIEKSIYNPESNRDACLRVYLLATEGVSFRGPLVTPRGLQGHALSTVTVPRHSGHSHFSRHCSSESVWLEPKPSAA